MGTLGQTLCPTTFSAGLPPASSFLADPTPPLMHSHTCAPPQASSGPASNCCTPPTRLHHLHGKSCPHWSHFLSSLMSQVCFAQSHGIQHPQSGQTSSLGPPSPSASPSQGAGRAAGGQHAALTLPEGPALSGSSLLPLLPSQGCPGSSAHCTSRVVSLSNFNLSAHHCSSSEQKEPEIAASTGAQPPWAGGGVRSNGGFCRGWCLPSQRQEVHPRIPGHDSAMVKDGQGGPGFPSKSQSQAQAPGASPCSSPGSPPPGSM